VAAQLLPTMSDDVQPTSADGAARGWDEFEPLYDAHHARLYKLAVLLCHGSEAMAEDAVAETFLRVYPAWAEGRVERFFPYARQTLVHQVLGDRHGDLVAATSPARRDGRPVGDSIAGASTTFQLLEQLAPEQRTAVVLRYFEDLSYDQIAATMGVSTGDAKAEVSVGLQRLRTLMGEEEAS
jgi:DNA-directed RNA polymerase specialized sigma24 family protein